MRIIWLTSVLLYSSCARDSAVNLIENNQEPVTVYLKEFSEYFLPDSCNCKMNIELSKSILQIEMTTCEGNMKFKQMDAESNLICEGQYISSLDTLKKYAFGRSAIDGSGSVKVLKYFQPLPDGKWKYYTKNGKADTIYYSSGLKVQNGFDK